MTDDIVDRLRDIGSELDVLDACRDAAIEIERLRAEADQIAAWIVSQTGYPLDFDTAEPVPAAWQQRIEDAWLRWHEARDAESDDDLRELVRTEGGWAK